MHKILILLALSLPFSAGLAQTTTTAASKPHKTQEGKLGKQQQKLVDLVSKLAPEDQEKLKALQASRQEMEGSLKSLRQKAKEVYQAAIKDQKSPQEARLLAQKALMDDRIMMAGKTTELRNSFQELVKKYPALKAVAHQKMKSQFMKHKHHKKHHQNKNQKQGSGQRLNHKKHR